MPLNDPEWSQAFILLGTVLKPHGIRGELKVRPCTETPDNFCRYRRVYLAAKEEQPKVEFANVQARVNGNSVILRLQECTDRDQAEQLVGLHVWLANSDLPPAGSGEFYLHSLIGKQVRTIAGQRLGMVRGLLSSAQDVLVIGDGDHEYLVPAVREFIVAMEETEIVLDLPPGLLEINR